MYLAIAIINWNEVKLDTNVLSNRYYQMKWSKIG